MDTYSNTTTPEVSNLKTTDGALVRNLYKTNVSRLESLHLEPPELVTFKAADGVTNLYGMLYKPSGFDPSKKYPLIVQVYGGPTVHSIRESYVLNGSEQRLAQLGYMVWRMDNRGTPGRGRAFERSTYLKLGQIDLDDQAAGVRHLTRTHPYVDSTRVGITGGSYGGYMSALALLRYPDVFHVGVASSSVTDWRNYDSIYTERYMWIPQENKDGYDKGSAMTYAKNLR